VHVPAVAAEEPDGDALGGDDEAAHQADWGDSLVPETEEQT
jgi:hypothetical protein